MLFRSQDLIAIDLQLRRSCVKLLVAGCALALVLYVCQKPVVEQITHWTTLRDEAALVVLGVIGFLTYGGATLLMFGRRLQGMLRGRGGSTPSGSGG